MAGVRHLALGLLAGQRARFLQRAATGTLPTAVANGVSPAQAAVEGAASWGMSVTTWSWINLATSGFAFMVFSLVAMLIWWRVRTGFGLLTAFVLLLGGSSTMAGAIYGANLSTMALRAWEIGGIVWPLFFLWLYLFPNGRAVPRRLLWILGPLLWLFAVQFLLSILSVFLTETSALAQIAAMVEPIGQLSIPILFFLTVGAQVYRYVKVSGAVEREQTKWFLLGLVLAFVPLLLLFLVVDTASMLGTIAFTALPIGIGISILRYRLWDVDVIIRKTLVYTVVTALLALVYFGSVVLLQRLFGALTGAAQSPLAVVVSTLAIAALFTPLRRRIQDWIDRRFFRKKYNAQQVLAQFALTARDETDLDALTAELVRVVQETMQPEHASVWLRKQEAPRGILPASGLSERRS